MMRKGRRRNKKSYGSRASINSKGNEQARKRVESCGNSEQTKKYVHGSERKQASKLHMDVTREVSCDACKHGSCDEDVAGSEAIWNWAFR